MIEQVEYCTRCFTLKGKGFFAKWKTKKDLKSKGHIIFQEKKNNKHWMLVVSTRTYKGAIAT